MDERRKTIALLATDDEIEIIQLLKALFKRHPRYTLEICNEPEEAIEFLQLMRFDAIITDFHMPKITGAELAKKVRELKNGNREQPIIFYSAYTPAAKDALKVDPMENVYFLEKPLPMEDLFKQVEEIIKK